MASKKEIVLDPLRGLLAGKAKSKMKLEELKAKLQIAVEQVNLSIEALNAEILEKYNVPMYTQNSASGEIKEWKKGKYHRYYANIRVNWNFLGKRRGHMYNFGNYSTHTYRAGYLNINTNRYNKDNKYHETIDLTKKVPDVSSIIEEIRVKYIRFAKETVLVNPMTEKEYEEYKERKELIKEAIEEKVLKNVARCSEFDYDTYEIIKKIVNQEITYEKGSSYEVRVYNFIWGFYDLKNSDAFLNMTSSEAVSYCKEIVAALEPAI